MQIRRLAIPDVVLMTPRVFDDERGVFFESFNHRAFCQALDVEQTFVQDNQSESRRGVLRGLHYQLAPQAQGKLVRVTRGKIFDVAVDIRDGSPTFGRWVGESLSSDSRQQLWVPPGFAHGFLALSEVAQVQYKTTDYYAPDLERSIRWDDPTIGIDWPDGDDLIISQKDREAVGLDDAKRM